MALLRHIVQKIPMVLSRPFGAAENEWIQAPGSSSPSSLTAYSAKITRAIVPGA
jgi:hypothetical protein